MNTHNAFGTNPGIGNCCGDLNDPIVDKLIGNAYYVVKFVAMRMPFIKTLNDNIDDLIALAGSLEGLNDLADKLPELMALQTELQKLIVLYNNLADLVLVADNMTQILTVHDNLPQIQTIVDNLTQIQTVVTNIASIVSVASNIAAVNNVNSNMPAVLNVNTNMAAVNNVSTNMTDVRSVANNMSSVTNVSNNMAEILAVYNLLPDVQLIVQNLQDMLDFANNLAASDGSEKVGFIDAGTGAVARTVEDRLRDHVSVRGFGALGLGSVDETPLFTAALASPASRIYVPEGTYILEDLKIPAGKKLYGPGTLKWKNAATKTMITFTGARGSLEGLNLDGNRENQTQNLIMVETLTAPSCSMLNCKAFNGRYKLFRTDVSGSPFMQVMGNDVRDWGDISGCNVFDFRSSYALATNNRIQNVGDGHCFRIGVYDSDPAIPVIGTVISNNVMKDTIHVGVCIELYAQHVTVSGNSFDNLEQGVKIESQGNTAFDLSVTGNVFKNLTAEAASNNLSGTRVVFSGNTLLNCGSTALGGPGVTVSNNIFRNCGAAARPSIEANSASLNAQILGNLVFDSPYDGILVGGAGSICLGNRVIGSARRGISAAADSLFVHDNHTTGGTHGIVTSSACTNLHLVNNKATGATTANYSITLGAGTYMDQSNIGWTGFSGAFSPASGVLTLNVAMPVLAIKTDTEGGAASGDINTITQPNVTPGMLLMLRPNTASRVTTVKHGTGNIRLAGGADFVMNTSRGQLTLMWSGDAWEEISRSANT
ncbi:appendage [Achromobacter phage vB_AxyP_19-32_Axy11]|uniref:Putative tail fiber protein n=1 Tax=Achromobacter phage vB_AxyP_19-32_Axy11 TaxID=2591042 RepID=A0A514CU53_9CAUD|nr:appendage [Achromobacter phage vB_AxyP_19-32_Axy11]QDH84001.1 putative tail fiber protein [Achromobacter phage vB_AxyP_19-32_Axy11]